MRLVVNRFDPRIAELDAAVHDVGHRRLDNHRFIGGQLIPSRAAHGLGYPGAGDTEGAGVRVVQVVERPGHACPAHGERECPQSLRECRHLDDECLRREVWNWPAHGTLDHLDLHARLDLVVPIVEPVPKNEEEGAILETHPVTGCVGFGRAQDDLIASVRVHHEVFGRHELRAPEWVVENLHAHVRDGASPSEHSVRVLGADRRDVDVREIGVVEAKLADEAWAARDMWVRDVMIIGRSRVLHLDQSNEVPQPLRSVRAVFIRRAHDELARRLKRVEKLLKRCVAIRRRLG